MHFLNLSESSDYTTLALDTRPTLGSLSKSVNVSSLSHFFPKPYQTPSRRRQDEDYIEKQQLSKSIDFYRCYHSGLSDKLC